MKTKSILVVAMVVCFYLPKANADLIFDDGGTHNVNYTINDILRIQNNSTVNLLSGGVTNNWVYVHQYSHLNILGGTVKKRIHAYGAYVTVSDGVIEDYLESYNYAGTVKSHITVSGGVLQTWLKAYNGSYVNITGGNIQAVRAYDDSQVLITGGVFTDIWDEIIATHNGVITISGTGFNYDYGEIPVSSGTLTGTLDSGEQINNNFKIVHYGEGYDNASIVLVPEPATLLLLGLGAVMLRKRNR